MSDNNSFRSIAKANAIFGGVTFYSIIISIAQSKLVAVLLGPIGYGVMGLFNSSIDLISSFTNCGLANSAIRDVSEANASGDKERITQTYSILSNLVWITGTLGLVLTLILAPWLSEWTFGDRQYTYAFYILSIVLLLRQLEVKYAVVLQGMRKHKLLAKTSIWGKTLSFLAIIPIYYFWRISGVVPAIIVMALITLVVRFGGFKKLELQKEKMTIKQSFSQGRTMIVLGIMLSITGILDMIVMYLLKAGIQNMGSLHEVGLFTSGFGMVTTYVGLVFSSISTDYYPRLASVANDKDRYNDIINKQYHLMILVLTPLVLALIEFMPIVIKVLYTDEFLEASSMMKWMAFGMIYRAFSWGVGFMFLAKGDSKPFLLLYLLNFIFELVLYYFGYKWGGLMGLGVAFVLFYIYSAISTLLVTYKLYGCKYNTYSYLITALSTAVTISMLILSSQEGSSKYFFMSVLLLGFALYSFFKLKKLLELKLSSLSTIFKKR